MSDIVRIHTEQQAVAAMGAHYQLTLSPANIAAELEANMWLAEGAVVQFRTSAGKLLGELPAAAVTVCASALPSYEPGTGAIADCVSTWTSNRWQPLPHTHVCRHTAGHAHLSDLPHECACGATLPI